MTDLIKTLCERLSQGLDRDPQRLADQLGVAHPPAAPGLPINVTPSNPAFAAMSVFADGDATSSLTLIPAGELVVGTLENMLGAYEESARLQPQTARQLVFSPGNGAQPFSVQVVADVSPDKTLDAAAPVRRVTIICSPAFAKEDASPPLTQPAPPAVWPPLLGAPASFEVRAWRTYSLTTLEDIKHELENALGIQLTPTQGPAYVCAMPACELRLSARPSEHESLQVFALIGASSGNAEDISEALASHLRGADCDWYVPSAVEKNGDALNQELLDRDVLVSLLAPRWLAWSEGDDRETSRGLLEGIADVWLEASRKSVDPVAEVKKRKADFQGWGRYFPRSRTSFLFSYAVQAQLAVIEDELFELDLLPAEQRAAAPELATRLAEWREVVVGLDEAVTQTRNPEIRSQYAETLASIDKLAEELRGRKRPPIWQRLLGAPARFRLKSVRRATLDQTRAELERALGVEFFALHDPIYNGPPAFRCVTHACDLGLNSSPSPNPELIELNFIGVPGSADAETISDELAQRLRAANLDWTVSDDEEGPVV
jgi:hypothetical protein